MCGIFGIISNTTIKSNDLNILAKFAEERGKDSSGVFLHDINMYKIYRENKSICKLLKHVDCSNSNFIMGHSRLITNGLTDNQPVYRDDVCVIHNGIIVNDVDVWSKLEKKRQLQIDTEVIAAIAADVLKKTNDPSLIAPEVLRLCKGVVACAIALPTIGKICLFSNNGSLYFGTNNGNFFFASEHYPLVKLNCDHIQQIRESATILSIPISRLQASINENKSQFTCNLIPELGSHKLEESLLEYEHKSLRRCVKCILPETMPYIHFDEAGVCNYCNNYKIRNKPKPVQELLDLVEIYRRKDRDDCLVPFSGGRDSCYGLHLIIKELKMKPVTYTYDWGMVTDLGRRNISRMSSQLGVENIIIAADIREKRRNIARNMAAWLRSPHLGMVSILTAGDKHFFRHVETVKHRTGISLNMWGVNPLEVTHFKAGFLGVPPDFEEHRVYSHGYLKQIRYQWLRLNAMLKSPSYFNSSLWDTLSGEYYRSFHTKSDYFHIFDYWRWDEKIIDDTLLNVYEWERAPDTNTTWRIGDGTAAIYNYIYYTVAGFTEHDTFRSNQIREGDITREEALMLVADENRPRYPNIKWYFDAIDMDFSKVIPIINAIPKLIHKP